MVCVCVCVCVTRAMNGGQVRTAHPLPSNPTPQRGLVRGLLNSGAMVVVNSRSVGRLNRLAADLGHPERLVGLCGSLLPGHGQTSLLKQIVEVTGGNINHVVAHCNVRWWSPSAGDEMRLPTSRSPRTFRFLDLAPADFQAQSDLLRSLHFGVAQSLLPLLSPGPANVPPPAGAKGDGEEAEGGEAAAGQGRPSYTFITGQPSPRTTPIAATNTIGVWGLSAAMRAAAYHEPKGVSISEVRVGLRMSRSPEERARHPRAYPLSADIGTLAAGIARHTGAHDTVSPLYQMDSVDNLLSLQSTFPAPDDGSTLWWDQQHAETETPKPAAEE